MRSFVIILLVAFTGLLNGCEKSVNESRETSLSIRLEDCANNIFSDTQVRLCFDSVISDSRCPADAFCIWQGTAVAKFSLFNNGREYPFILSTLSLPGVYNKDTIVSGYKIEFIDLVPYPGLPPAPGNETKAEIKITRL